jgi:hypothetical protein
MVPEVAEDLASKRLCKALKNSDPDKLQQAYCECESYETLHGSQEFKTAVDHLQKIQEFKGKPVNL